MYTRSSYLQSRGPSYMYMYYYLTFAPRVSLSLGGELTMIVPPPPLLSYLCPQGLPEFGGGPYYDCTPPPLLSYLCPQGLPEFGGGPYYDCTSPPPPPLLSYICPQGLPEFGGTLLLLSYLCPQCLPEFLQLSPSCHCLLSE